MYDEAKKICNSITDTSLHRNFHLLTRSLFDSSFASGFNIAAHIQANTGGTTNLMGIIDLQAIWESLVFQSFKMLLLLNQVIDYVLFFCPSSSWLHFRSPRPSQHQRYDEAKKICYYFKDTSLHRKFYLLALDVSFFPPSLLVSISQPTFKPTPEV
jgi:hypothetical protein